MIVLRSSRRTRRIKPVEQSGPFWQTLVRILAAFFLNLRRRKEGREVQAKNLPMNEGLSLATARYLPARWNTLAPRLPKRKDWLTYRAGRTFSFQLPGF